MITTLTILPTTVFGQPSGNYDGSSQDWSGDAAQAANFYVGRGSLQSFVIQVTGFIGLISLEATLDTLQDTATWFSIYDYGDLSSATTDYHPVPITGNFVWLRARVQGFDGGTINSVTVTY